MEKYNGWTNRDTWLVALWIDNDRTNYKTVGRNKDNFLKYSDEAFRKTLSYLNYGSDEVDFSQVDLDEIREVIQEIEV